MRCEQDLGVGRGLMMSAICIPYQFPTSATLASLSATSIYCHLRSFMMSD